MRRLADLGTRLRALRRAAGLTQAELADAAGIDHTYLSKIEHGAVEPPSVATLRRMADRLCPSGADALWDELVLLSGRIPRDVQELILAHPESVALIRRTYGDAPVCAKEGT